MRIKLSDKYQTEREIICNRIITILALDDKNTFLLYELDNDIVKQQQILEMKDEIQKYFAFIKYLDYKNMTSLYG